MIHNELILELEGNPVAHQSVRSRISFRKFTKALVRGSDKYYRLKDLFVHHYQKPEIVKMIESMRFEIKRQLPSGFKIWECPIFIKKLHYVFPPVTTLSADDMRLLQAEDHGTSPAVLEFRFGKKIVFKHTKPDLQDNLNKALFDALEGIVFKNDSQVCSINNMKKYYGLKPKTIIHLAVFEHKEK